MNRCHGLFAAEVGNIIPVGTLDLFFKMPTVVLVDRSLSMSRRIVRTADTAHSSSAAGGTHRDMQVPFNPVSTRKSGG